MIAHHALFLYSDEAQLAAPCAYDVSKVCGASGGVAPQGAVSRYVDHVDCSGLVGLENSWSSFTAFRAFMVDVAAARWQLHMRYLAPGPVLDATSQM